MAMKSRGLDALGGDKFSKKVWTSEGKWPLLIPAGVQRFPAAGLGCARFFCSNTPSGAKHDAVWVKRKPKE